LRNATTDAGAFPNRFVSGPDQIAGLHFAGLIAAPDGVAWAPSATWAAGSASYDPLFGDVIGASRGKLRSNALSSRSCVISAAGCADCPVWREEGEDSAPAADRPAEHPPSTVTSTAAPADHRGNVPRIVAPYS
jgi:hypothetical protein